MDGLITGFVYIIRYDLKQFIIIIISLAAAACFCTIGAQTYSEPDSSVRSSPYLLLIGREQDSASNLLCDYLWEQLLKRDFESVIDTCSRVAFSYSDNACIAGHLAHAYLLSNHYEKAREIYLALPEFVDEILNDFDEFAKYGIYHHDFDKIRLIFNTKPHEELKNGSKP